MNRVGRPLALSVDLGGTKTVTAVVTGAGKTLARELFPTPVAEGVAAELRAAAQSLRRVMAEADISLGDVTGIGLSMPGISNSETGVVHRSPNLPDWQDVPVGDFFRNEFGCPAMVINDANAGALGEMRFGAAHGLKDIIYLTISTGIGGGIVTGGKLYTGTGGLAGELGHMTVSDDDTPCPCGSKGCWEMMASGTALGREARRRLAAGDKSKITEFVDGDIARVTAREVHRAYDEGDALAAELVRRAAYYLGVGLINTVNIFNPEMVVIGGGMMVFGEDLLGPAREMVMARAYPESARQARIVAAELGGDAPLLGAAAWVLENSREA